MCLQVFHSHGSSRRNMFAAKDMQAFRYSCRVSFITFE